MTLGKGRVTLKPFLRLESLGRWLLECRPCFNGEKVNAESYACDFLRDRGYQAGRDYDASNCVDRAARVLTSETYTLAAIREGAAMAQFSEREIRSDVLRLIEQTGHLAGDTQVLIDAVGVKVIQKETA